tara:strand:+ start:487 stop:843 length:357 start_codon:yes stop_codon:yes gene_type:complete
MKTGVYHNFINWVKRLVSPPDQRQSDTTTAKEESPTTIALRRLAILESRPVRSITDLEEWRVLRKWVLDNELLDDYQNQDYFLRSREVTKNGFAPKKSSSIFSRFWTFFKKAGKETKK